ncbi:MAG: DctP family TRAP transporter solute-binding subunit [Pseudomonadota bacterium]|nr:DctP family TRAP transporter solute-binding subunit [Pseudomonadota bacterium]
MSSTRNTVVVLTLACLFSGCSTSNDAESGMDDVIVIKFPHVVAPGTTPKGQTAARFEELVEARFPGRVDVEVYPSAQLMNDDDSLEALAFGEIQMIAVSLSKFDRLTQSFQIFDLPFLFSDIAAVERFQGSPEGRSLLTTLDSSGFHGLAFWHNGMKHFGADRPLHRPEDAQGLRFRIMESDVLQAQIEAIGSSPQKMGFEEVYQALQTGAIDAQENTWSNIYSSKFHEVQPYFMVSNHGYVGYFVAVNAPFWSSLPEDVRLGLEEIMAEVTEWGNARSIAINEEGRAKMLESGRTEIIELTDEELVVWQDSVQTVWDQFSDEIGPEIIEAAQREAARR